VQDDNDYDDDYDDDRVSKSQVKREMEALRVLGQQLTALTPSQLETIPLPEKVVVQVVEAKRMRSHLATKRQMQYLGKVLRDVEIEPIKKALEILSETHKAEVAFFHGLEQLRDKLVQEGDSAIQDVLDEYPAADRQALRQMVRNAKKTDQVKYKRQIFRYLSELHEQKESN
jgi:ribosome-associated protein